MHTCLRHVAIGAATLTAFTFVRGGHAAEVLHVNGAAPPGGDGSSWASAFDDLHDALAAASAGDSVWVTGGVYTPAAPGGSRFAAFTIPGGVSVYGGFAGDESSPDERPAGFPSILDGDLDGDDGAGFANYGDNVHHVVIAGGDPNEAVLDGFTVRGGNADGASGSPPSRGGGVYVAAGSITIRGCTLTHNFASGGGGGVSVINGALALEQCLFLENLVPSSHGGGARVEDGTDVTIAGTRFQGNESDIGAGIAVLGADSLTVTDSQFLGNYSEASGGGIFAVEITDTVIAGAEFRDNDGGFTGGAMIHGGTTASISDSIFASNTASNIAGGIGTSAALTMVNCVFSRNDSFAQGGAALLAGPSSQVTNCTFANNDGGAILTDGSSGAITFRNSIIWGNTGDPFRGPVTPDVAFCDVEGGWPGSNNIDADPLFVQPGTDNVRLSVGSPVLDQGDNGSVPAGVDTDLDGNDRIQNGTVDLGAYEGVFEPLPPAAMVTDIDIDETVLVILGDGAFDMLSNEMLVVGNESGSNDETMIAIDHTIDLHPEAGGFTAMGSTLDMETTFDTGEFHACIVRPFTAADLAGADPMSVNVTRYAPETGHWAYAVYANTQPSPGHGGVFGDRIAVIGPGFAGLTTDVGDYGVYWDPTIGKGFAWANVDGTCESSFGLSLCAADVQQPPDGIVNMADLFAVIAAWGSGSGPADVNVDGVVNAADLIALIGAWGMCDG
ncbi:MAG: right-handed parallel beta-helix repeat-containing protein [Planctomycetota bacterium]|jgi:hypothetical protein